MKTKTNKPINKQNDAELRVSTDANQSPTPLAYDDILESTGTKVSFPEVFEQVDDQHSRVPGTDTSSKGAWLASGGQSSMSRDIASLAGPTDGYAYADMIGTGEMYRKQPDKQVLSVSDPSINTGSLSGGNRAANITPGHVGTAQSGTYDKADRN